MHATTNQFKNWTIEFLKEPEHDRNLRFALYHPDGPNFDQCIIFANGRTEWIEKYTELPHNLQLPHNCAFLTWDHRGQGASSGTRGYIDHYDTYGADAACIVNHTLGKKPYAALAHSMGGLISLYATLKGLLEPKYLVLGSPLLGLPNRPLPRKISKPLSKLLATSGFDKFQTGAGNHDSKKFERSKLTHSFERHQRIQTTPYPCPSASFGWVNQSFKAIDFVFDESNLKRLKAPTLVLGPSEETIVDIGSYSRWVQKANEVCEVKISLEMIQGARHELFSEIPQYCERAEHLARQWFHPFFEPRDSSP